MKFIVVRHGETRLNKENRLQGQGGSDEGLDAQGRRAVEKLTGLIAETPSAMYASPLRRTMETAQILNRRFRVALTPKDELAERDFGTLSEKLRTEIDPKLAQEDLEGTYDYRPYGGESAEDVRARLLRFLATLPLSSSETVMLVTHRGIIRILYDMFPSSSSGDPILPASLHLFTVNALPTSR